MATAKKLPSGSYRVRVLLYTDENKKKHYKSFTASSKVEAERQAANFLVDYKEGKIKDTISEKNDNNVSFTQAMIIYLNAMVNVLSPTTYTGYKCIESTLKKDVPDFCNMDITKIKQNDVQIVVNTLAKKVKPKTVRNRHGFISKVLEFNGIDIKLKTTLPKKEFQEKIFPDDNDFLKLLDIVKDTNLEIPVMLGGYGMLRVGEVCGLNYDTDINFKTGEITIRHSQARTYEGEHIIKSPKSYSGNRNVFVPKVATDLIKKQGYVTDLKPETISSYFSDLTKKSFDKHFTFHALRHYGASVRIYLGIPLEYIRKEGGWSDTSTLQKIYAHCFPDKQEEFTALTLEYFDKLNKKDATKDDTK